MSFSACVVGHRPTIFVSYYLPGACCGTEFLLLCHEYFTHFFFFAVLRFYCCFVLSCGVQELGSANAVQLAVSPSLSVGVDLLTSLFDDADPTIRCISEGMM